VADLLVTGTDTGVGKTVVAAALVLALREKGVRAVGFKPVESGIGDDKPADSAILSAASGTNEPLLEPLMRLGEALAPAVAATRARLALDPAAVLARIEALRGAGYTIVVEGAGGLLAPLAWGFTALDLAAQAGLEAVVVARAGLGTLNHVLLTAQALASRGVPLRAVVLNGVGDPPNLAEATNPEALARLLPGVPLAVVARHATTDSLEAARRCAPSLSLLSEAQH
jgi:dethiobiotin synthetase